MNKQEWEELVEAKLYAGELENRLVKLSIVLGAILGTAVGLLVIMVTG